MNQESKRERSSWTRVFELFRDGQRLESVMSGWRVTEEQIAEYLIAGHRAGEKVEPAWVLPPKIRDRVMEFIQGRADLSPTQISSMVQGRVKPAIIRALRQISQGMSFDTRLYNESTFFEKFHDDLAGATREIIVVASEIKGQHWRKHAAAFLGLVRREGQVGFFSGRISELLEDSLRDAGIVLIEKHSHANLVLIDNQILWEGSMNFLLPPQGDEHVRRSESRLQVEEVKDLNDLFL
ncbi:MAG: hypothetical protein V3W41_17685 [Planctomycetota bacterium]